MAAIAEAKEVIVGVKQLRDDHIRTRIDLALQICKIGVRARSFLMRLGITGHSNPEFRKLIMNECHQLVRVTQSARHWREPRIALRRIPAKGHYILHAARECGSQVFAKLLDGAANAS